MDNSLLKIENLSLEYKLEDQRISALNNLSLSLNKGESLGIIGESGSGKTSMAMAIMGLVKNSAHISGNIYFKDKDINKLSKRELEGLRWKKMAIVFQNSLDILNPLLTIYEQIDEVLVRHRDLTGKAREKRIEALFKKVNLDLAMLYSYPHELSGGMRQRVLIAMALACEPELLIVDEPTSALDMVSKAEIIELLSNLYKENNFALLVISHELDTVLKLTSKVCVMYAGSIVEKGKTLDILRSPRHSYSKGLLNSSPSVNIFGDMWGIPNERMDHENTGCPFKNRCTQSIDICGRINPKLEYISKERQVACHRGGIVTILKGENISKTYKSKDRSVNACLDCNLHIKSGEIVALIGESGSGKTTLASILSGIDRADKGIISFEDGFVKGNNFTSRENGIQMVFQDPFSAINEKLSIKEAISEPLKIIKKASYDSLEDEIREILGDLQLPQDDIFLNRKCHTLSGGQRQRLSLARSLIVKPKILIADEITSMLDPSTQANILRLLKKLQNEKGFSMLYITHDLAVARKIADRVYIMSGGEIVESGSSSKIFAEPVA